MFVSKTVFQGTKLPIIDLVERYLAWSVCDRDLKIDVTRPRRHERGEESFSGFNVDTAPAVIIEMPGNAVAIGVIASDIDIEAIAVMNMMQSTVQQHILASLPPML